MVCEKHSTVWSVMAYNQHSILDIKNGRSWYEVAKLVHASPVERALAFDARLLPAMGPDRPRGSARSASPTG